jgi:hypothetical protein
VSDIDTAVVDSLKALDLEWPIREADIPESSVRANCGLMHRSKRDARCALLFRAVAPPHSITSSAMASSLSGTVSPSALAVLRLMTNSYLVGASTGRSAGFSPLRMRST